MEFIDCVSQPSGPFSPTPVIRPAPDTKLWTRTPTYHVIMVLFIVKELPECAGHGWREAEGMLPAYGSVREEVGNICV
jgi:hypothetical protein